MQEFLQIMFKILQYWYQNIYIYVCVCVCVCMCVFIVTYFIAVGIKAILMLATWRWRDNSPKYVGGTLNVLPINYKVVHI